MQQTTKMSANDIRSLISPEYVDIVFNFLTDYTETVRHELMDECLKFLWICSSINKKAFVPVSQDVDNVWHAFILQTRLYPGLCSILPGKDFIHHQSGSFHDYMSATSGQLMAEELVFWLTEYHRLFGDFTAESAKHWVIVNFLMQGEGLSLADVNTLAAGGEVSVSLTDTEAPANAKQTSVLSHGDC
ncbi:hypothetical protein [Pantoea cypripedii]|nr:hypothetical protein [Pantoea cypripedii]MBP2200158.1 hypothetical protein [Pantoea cypripedii]